ncbi:MULTISPECIES: diacylglycerol kinase [unclassified Mycoplasma]|uniref:diacylglycerol kinase n=1 Tax=unclassified Mycoplasma TaxID=2683645 RepID=UPI000FDE33AE
MLEFIRKIHRKTLYSLVGLWVSFREEKSLVTLLIIAIVVIGFGIWLGLSPVAWGLIILTLFLSIVIEIINTALEAAVDTISFQYNVKVKKIKDIASAATLLTSLASFAVILIVYIPRFVEVFG